MIYFENVPTAKFEELTAEDFRVYMRVAGFHANETGRDKAARRWGCLLMLLVVVVCAFYWYFTETVSLMMPVYVLLFLVIFGWVFRLIQLRKIVRLSKGPIEVSLEEAGIRWNDATSDSLVRWDAIQGMYERNRVIAGVVDEMRCLIIPARAFEHESDYQRFSEAIADRIPVRDANGKQVYFKVQKSIGPRSRVRKIWDAAGWTLVVGLLVAIVFTPWRTTTHLPGVNEDIRWFELITANAEDRPDLPLVFSIHGYGSMPELDQVLFRKKIDFPARVIFPVGPHRWLIGHKWDDWDEDEDPFEVLAEQYVHQVKRISELSRIFQEEYPDAGVPVITGYSQGGSLTWAAAVLASQDFKAALPLSGALAVEISEGLPSRNIPTRAIHGADDAIFPLEWAEGSVVSFQNANMDVELVVVPEMGHRLNAQARDQWRLWMKTYVTGEGTIP